MFADQLRKSILQAAIQGKLTEQLPTDGDARDLLKKIRAEKDKLLAEKKIKADKPLPPISDDEIPFDLPDNWCWCRLGEICQVKGGKRLPVGHKLTKINTGHKYIRVADMNNGTVVDNDIHFVPENIYPQIQNYIITSNDVYITCAGTIGRVGTVPLKFNGANLTENADRLVFTFLDKYWLKYSLNSQFLQDQISGYTTKVGQPKLAIKRIELLLIPLPPLAEQERIVARVEELLAEVNELARDEQELTALEENFPRQMKNSLLQAAIQGKLTEQLPTDGDARDLLKKIRAEKSKLIAEKKIKTEKPLPLVSEDEVPFDLPDNWCWVRLGEVCNYGTNETISPDAMKQGKLLIDLEDIEKDSGRLINRKIFDGTNANSSKNIFRSGQVLFGKLRVYLNKVIVADDGGYCSSEILPLDFGKNILSRYAQIVLMSPTFLNYANSCSYGTKMPRLGTKAGQLALFPLSPLAEQKRIVEKLNELLPLCEYNCYKDF